MKHTNTRTKAGQNAYAIHFEHEGRHWCEIVKAPAMYDAELLAKNEARARGLRVVATLRVEG